MEAEMALLGYARVSTDGQSLTAQAAELKAAGCTEIFQEKVSGAKPDRKQLGRLIGRLGPDDVLVVTRLDRLAGSHFACSLACEDRLVFVC
jgi:DNA invertase Pin-like site-specific DNA recombinase